MKKKIFIITLAAGSWLLSDAQSAPGAYSASRPDMKGTARYMGMAGAFGALGGDLSAITQNPGGIGVYRSSDIGFTLDLDLQSSSTENEGHKYKMDQTKFLLNNIGAVFTLKLPSQKVPNFNFGFVYNKGTSFNNIYGGQINTLRNSMSNYIAYTSNYDGISEEEVNGAGNRNPYNPSSGYAAPWMNILAYQAYVVNPQYNPATGETKWFGFWQNAMSGKDTSGHGQFVMHEMGGTNDFNIVLGGNIANILYWGMNFDIINFNYQLNTYWGESLVNAYGMDDQGNVTLGNAKWDFNSSYSLSGTGFNYQLGFILRPVQALRLGFAFHTPTWYSFNEEFIGGMDNYYYQTNGGEPGYNSYNFRTPWKILASAAGVLGDKFIVSFDYEWANYGKMRFSEPTVYNDDYYWDYPWDWWSNTRAGGPISQSFQNPNDPYYYENLDISDYYKSSNTFRVGVEFKPISSLSLRAGYANVSSPVRKEAKNNELFIATSSLSPSYRFDNSTNYATFGVGYRYSHFYVDLAYVYKHVSAEYHAYTNYPTESKFEGMSPQAKVSLNNNQIVLSAGYRF